jgi:Cellulase (glycosyl hydrolase family 5)
MLQWYGRPTYNVPNQWTAYFARSDFQQWKAKFGWNNIRLGFAFANTGYSGPENTLDCSGTDTTDIQTLKQVVAICAANGLQVMLCNFDFTGIAPFSDMSTWYADWTNLATAFAGDDRISIYQVANELEHSTTTNSVLQTVTSNIRAIDPTRAIAWWNYSPSGPAGGATWNSCPDFTNPGNIYLDLHIETYSSSTTCGTTQGMAGNISTVLKYQASCGYAPLFGEINAQITLCNPISVYLIEQSVAQGIPWIAWGYNEYRTNWNTIFGNVSLTAAETAGTISVVPAVLMAAGAGFILLGSLLLK